MTVGEFIVRLQRLNPKLEICIATIDGEAMTSIAVEDITESCDDDTVIGYILCPNDEPQQAEFDFSKVMN